FIAINCVGVPDSLLEPELFGHVRGSFTGAYRDRTGLLEGAHKGTVFLDEVCEMSPRMQALLLRFMETGEIQRVGSDRVQALVDFEWPGNVRQLKNVAERLIVRAQRTIITLADLPQEVTGRLRPSPVVLGSEERPAIEAVFDRMVKHRESFWSAVYPAFMI